MVVKMAIIEQRISRPRTTCSTTLRARNCGVVRISAKASPPSASNSASPVRIRPPVRVKSP